MRGLLGDDDHCDVFQLRARPLSAICFEDIF